MKRVLLSASFPSGDRGQSVAPYRPGDIGRAASAVAEAVLRAGARLVFGGHPTISPLVLQIAGRLRAGNQVEIWQSDWYLDAVTPEVLRLVEHEHASLRRVKRGSDEPSSLARLRDRMLKGDLTASFFVGGMEGIADEFRLLGRLHPTTPAFLFVEPGGTASRLAGRADRPVGPGRVTALEGRGYAALTLQALRGVDLPVGDSPGEL